MDSIFDEGDCDNNFFPDSGDNISFDDLSVVLNFVN